MNGEERVAALAARIVDGEPIDWETETGDEAMATRIRNLRALESIQALHAGAPGMHGTGDGAAAGDAESTPTRPFPGAGAPAGRASTGLRPGARWGTLELEELVGSGSYGEVWRAWDSSLHTHVALKLLFPRGRSTDEVLREARQMARVRHENVVHVYGAAVHGGHVGLWYNFIVGRTLERQLEEQGAMGPREAAALGIDLLRAVAAVHAAGLVHRDIKTSNVMREDGGRIVLMDFGTVVDGRMLESLSATDAFTGTAPYMAPEIFDGGRPSAASDVYALGVVLYRLVSDRYPQPEAAGRPPRPGETTPLRDARPDLPAAFVRIVERAMAADPAVRYASAGEMERDLAGFLAGGRRPVASMLRAVSRRPATRALAAVATIGAVAWLARAGLADGALSADAALFRDGSAGTKERLSSGDRVRPGDQLFLELSASRDVHVYVFTEDALGNAFLLFPIDGMQPSNPIRAGTRVRLPGIRNGQELRWDVESAGDEEALFVVASRRPLLGLERDLSDVPEAGSALAVPLSRESVRRSISGLSPAPAAGANGALALSAVFRDLSAAARSGRDLWTWSIRLENPLP
jgi:hypothetical protein